MSTNKKKYINKTKYLMIKIYKTLKKVNNCLIFLYLLEINQ